MRLKYSCTFVCFVNALLRGVGRAWILIAALAVVLSLIRLGQVAHFWPVGYQASSSDLTVVFAQGLRYDLKVSAVAGLLLLMVLPWVSGRVNAHIGAAVAFCFIMLSLINLHYFGFYKTPIDSMVFGLMEDDTVAVLQTIWRDFPVIITILLGIGLTACTVAGQAWLLRHAKRATVLYAKPMIIKLAVIVIALLAILMAGKGTLRAMALQRQHLTVTTSQFLNDMVPNGVIAFNYAWDSRGLSQNLQNPLAGLKVMGFDSPLAAAKVLGLPHNSEEAVKAALIAHGTAAASTKKNLLFFLMESWGAEPLLYQSTQFDVMGRMAPTMNDACHFSNFDSAQGGTHPTLEAILFSTPITPLTLGDVGRKPIPWSIPLVARQAGYQTLFVTSARAGWRDINRVLPAQGFDEIVDAATLKAAYPEASLGIWGVWDGYIFEYLRNRLAVQPADKPIFVFVLSSTNHPPYDLPADYKRVPRDMKLWRGETGSDAIEPNLDSYHYATDQLGGFVQDIKNSPQYNNTIVAATGDHNVRTFGVYAESKRRYLMRQVPFVIWSKKLACGDQQTLPASHRDMFSTLLPLAGIAGPYINAGRNLLQPLKKEIDPINMPRALFFTGEARNAQGIWQLGNKDSFFCSSVRMPINDCRFNALDDLQERARYGLLDWNVRTSLKKANSTGPVDELRGIPSIRR